MRNSNNVTMYFAMAIKSLAGNFINQEFCYRERVISCLLHRPIHSLNDCFEELAVVKSLTVATKERVDCLHNVND